MCVALSEKENSEKQEGKVEKAKALAGR